MTDPAAQVAVVRQRLPAPPDVIFDEWTDAARLAEWMRPRRTAPQARTLAPADGPASWRPLLRSRIPGTPDGKEAQHMSRSRDALEAVFDRRADSYVPVSFLHLPAPQTERELLCLLLL